MKTKNELFFHIAFYISSEKKVLSGRTYKAESIISALEQYQKDETTPTLSMIKYVSNENNMNYEELRYIRMQRT